MCDAGWMRMSPRAATRHRPCPIDAVALQLQLHSWRPFHLPEPKAKPSKPRPNPYLFPTKRPCRADRSTPAPPIDDLSRLTLRDDPSLSRDDPLFLQDGYQRWIARKRRRRASRSVSVSGRSSDRSTTRLASLTCAAATCSDSSCDLMSWGSDVSDVRMPKPRDPNCPLSFPIPPDKEGAASASSSAIGGPSQEKDPSHSQGNESGYGSEPGYRGDGELGYGDEFDEDDDFDARHLLFWADHRITRDGNPRGMQVQGENKIGELKTHHRNRRKKIIM